ncbi:T9SS type A sorting domain-containing protein [Flavivirga spongiicola]|uniref:T9SS type A sorting domain-containing protein n=1 Tax=Flavivirga spongiicola TaxID=421621 RepID=A0ABU7XUC1_9FLAO|nr:T9SS type A sorting domain-containing protein [Flavivirga sp. MEBiC05379]MDO5979388.1 T9SS type A sorting domain-containing protein [Flavivirga sp. MEBiC05379]
MKKITQKIKVIVLIFTFLFLGISSAYSQWTQVGQDIDGEAAVDRSGRSVSISADGTIVAIGASSNGGNGTDSGHVRVYQNINGTWFQLGQDIDGPAASVFFGNEVSLSSNGLRLAVHAVRNTGVNINSGETTVYDFSGGNWVQVGTGILGAGNNDGNGTKIDISSDGLHVAIGSSTNSSFSGNVRVFSFNGTNWLQTGADFVGNAVDQLGRGVSLSANGSRLAIAIPGDDSLGSSLGSTRVYEYNGSAWIELGSGIAGELANDNPGGVSLSSDGNRVAMGASGNDGNGTISGHVRIFQYNGSDWVQMGSDINGETSGDSVGNPNTFSLSSDGLTVAIGAPSYDNSTGVTGYNIGHVRVFRYNGLDWIQQGNGIVGEAVQDEFGGAVSMSANGIVAVGAFNNDGSANLSGHVRVFEFPQSIWTGASQAFSLIDNSDWTQEANQDRITDNVWLTRANTGGIFNIAFETDYTSLVSPLDTEWAFGTTANIEALNFDTWENTISSDPQSMLNLDMVVHLLTDNIYIDIKFTSWTGNTLSKSGFTKSTSMQNGFSYQRSTNQALHVKMFVNENVLRLYPIPSSDFIKISGLTGIKNYAIYNILGTQLKSNNIKNNEPIDILDLTNGLYFIRIDNQKGIKFMKN